MTTAGVFNPAQRMVIPTGGIDFSSYLGGGYMTNPFSFGTANMFSGNPFGQFALPNMLAGNSFGIGQGFYSPQKYYVENLSLNNVIANLQKRIYNNESTKIGNSWEGFRNAIKNTREYEYLKASGNLTEGQIISYMADKYAKTCGVDLMSALNRNTHGNFVSGLYNGLTFGIARDKSADEWAEEMFGIEQPRGAGVKRVAGTAIGAGATTALLTQGVKLAKKNHAWGKSLKWLGKYKAGKIGAAAALIALAIGTVAECK